MINYQGSLLCVTILFWNTIPNSGTRWSTSMKVSRGSDGTYGFKPNSEEDHMHRSVLILWVH